MGAFEVVFKRPEDAIFITATLNAQPFDPEKEKHFMRITLAECYAFWPLETLSQSFNFQEHIL